MPQTLDDLEDFAERARRAQMALDEDDAQLRAVRGVLAQIHYEYAPRELLIDAGRGLGGVWLEVVCYRPDTHTGVWGTGRGGRRYLPPTFSASDVVRAAYGALAAYEEHELRESFRYRGVAVFGPHLNLDALADHLGATTHTADTQED